MTALAECSQISQSVTGRIMIEMSSCQDHFCLAHLQQFNQIRGLHLPASTIEPVSRIWMFPSATRQHLQMMPMWPTTTLTNTPCPFKSHLSA
jgi:hypothetical protein